MSLLNWLSRDKAAKVQADATGTARTEPERVPPPSAEAHRKSERMARRELLYSVVRESMARAGVLSASYKFKVLSLDAAGRQFLVMVDLASSERADADMLADIEAGIAQRAKSRHELVVSAVYWRRNDQVGVGAQRPSAPRHAQKIPHSAPSQPAELVSEPAPLRDRGQPGGGRAAGGPDYDPIQDDEMQAFRAALADGLTPAETPAAPASGNGSAKDGGAKDAGAKPARNYTLLTGFEDTELREQAKGSRTLSSTQSGDLN